MCAKPYIAKCYPCQVSESEFDLSAAITRQGMYRDAWRNTLGLHSILLSFKATLFQFRCIVGD